MRQTDSHGYARRRSQYDQLHDERDQHLEEETRTPLQLSQREIYDLMKGPTTCGGHRPSPVFPAEPKRASAVRKSAPAKTGRRLKGLETRIRRETTVAQTTFELVDASEIGFSRVIELMYMELEQDEQRNTEARTKSGAPAQQPHPSPQNHLYR